MVNQSGGDGGDNIVIRTMKDDLAGGASKSLPAAPTPAKPMTPPAPMSTMPAPAVAPKPMTMPMAQPAKPAMAMPAMSSPPTPPPPAPTQFPLPPKGKTVTPATPNVSRRNRRRFLVWGSVTAVLLLLIGGGVWAFVTFVSAPAAPTEEASENTIPFAGSVPVPSSASVAIHYNLTNPNVRSQFLQLWQNSAKTLLQGNPKDLLQNANVSEFMYVMLSGESRPYVVVPKTGIDQQFIAQLSESQVTEVNGLYVLHSLSAQPYLSALRQTTTPDPLVDQLDDATSGKPLNIYLGEGALNQIRAGVAGEAFAAGSTKSAILSADLSSDKKALVFTGTGKATQATTSTAPVSSPLSGGFVQTPAADQALLAGIPGDATFVQLGGNLAQDIQDLETVSTILDKTILDQTSVAALVKQLKVPYAFYRRLGADGVEDLGLLTKLPTEVNPAIVLGDTTLEQAFQAMVPLILPTKPVTLPAFADGAYQTVPLRFANLLGATKALDYAIQGTTLSLATSKEGMFSAVDVAAKKQPAFEASAPWQALLGSSGPVPVTPQAVWGYLTSPNLIDLLPSIETKLPVVITEQPSESGLHLTGAVLLSTTAPAAPAPLSTSSTPTPL